MRTPKRMFWIIALFVGGSAQVSIDESAMFADTSSLVDSAGIVNTEVAVRDMREEKTVGFSGEMYAYADPSFDRAWFGAPAFSSVGISSRIVGNGLLDMRLVGGAKAFADMEAAYVPAPSYDPALSTGLFGVDSGALFTMREFFVDANYKRLVYVRVGKQVLQWGRCFLWNPTDLVNVEKKTFIRKMGHREGTYGIKIHVPYKTLFNFYSFIDAGGAATLHDFAAAVKAEVLVGRTEMALSMWGRRDRTPVFGLDFSTRAFNTQVAGEVSLTNGKDMRTLDMGDTTITDMGAAWIPRVSVNGLKFFALNGVADRLMASVEFYYNHAGYPENIFKNGSVDYQRIITTLLLKNYDLPSVIGLYEANSYSKYYAMLSASISRFILDDMTLSCSAVGNLDQRSFIFSAGLSYQSLHNFIMGVSCNAFLGPDNTEYTFLDNGLVVQIRTGIIF